MAQHDYVIANGTGAAVRSDLNNGLTAIVSNNSGATEPATMYAYQWWADTTTGLLKIRNAANNAWVTVGTLASANLGLLTSGSTLTAALGSASTPGITFTGDLNTGIYSPGADQVAISTNGTGRVFVDASGRVLVGTSSARNNIFNASYSALFQVETDTTVTSQALLTSATAGFQGARLTLAHQRSGGIGGNTILQSGDETGFLSFQGSDGSEFVESASIKGEVDGTPGANDMPGRLVFLTTSDGSATPTERMRIDSSGTTTLTSASATAPFIAKISTSEVARIDSSGRFLVGTSTAIGSFQFAGSSRASGCQIVGDTIDNGSFAVVRTTTGPVIYMGAGTSGTNVISGNALGYHSFHGYHTSAYYEGARITAVVDGTPGAGDMPGALLFSTTADGASSPTERMRIGNLGLVTIGTTDTRNLDVYRAGTTAGNEISTWYSDIGGTKTARAYFRNDGGLANFSANNVNLSDRNVKKDIATAASTWDCLKDWEIVNFRYKDQPDDADLNLGVIAQQVAESCPEVITVFQEAKEATEDQPAKEERLGVKDQQMMWMAIKALQEAQLRIEALEAEVAALKAQ